MRLISRNEVLTKTTFSRPTLFRKERAGEFPKAIQISANRVAYDEEMVDAWIQNKLQQASAEEITDALSEQAIYKTTDRLKAHNDAWRRNEPSISLIKEKPNL